MTSRAPGSFGCSAHVWKSRSCGYRESPTPAGPCPHGVDPCARGPVALTWACAAASTTGQNSRPDNSSSTGRYFPRTPTAAQPWAAGVRPAHRPGRHEGRRSRRRYEAPLVIAPGPVTSPDLLWTNPPPPGPRPGTSRGPVVPVRSGHHFVLTTALMDYAEQLANRLIVVDGTIMAEGSPAQLIPSTLHVMCSRCVRATHAARCPVHASCPRSPLGRPAGDRSSPCRPFLFYARR